MPFNLFDDLRKTGWHSSIMTTFSVDPAFYDANVQYRLRAVGCQNNLLLADAGMLTQAIEAIPEAFVDAGKTYLIQPVNRAGSFHPKISLRYGKNKARLIVGSANVTAAGWGRNKEVISALSWSRTSTDVDNDIAGRIIKKTHNYLIGLLPENKPETLNYKINLLASQSQWLEDIDENPHSEELNDGSQINILFGSVSGTNSLLKQFADNISDKIEKLLIISPYWDMGLLALNELRSKIGSCPVNIFMNPGYRTEVDIDSTLSTFPIERLMKNDGIKFYDLSQGKNQHRFLHAKIIVAQSKHHDYVLYGSANCTRAALGTYDNTGKNEEASFFRRLDRGKLESELKLSLDKEIPRKALFAPIIEKTSENAQLTSFFAGTMDKHRKKILWDCAHNIAPIGAVIECNGAGYNVNVPVHGRPFVILDTVDTSLAIIAKVRLPDGRISAPIIVSNPDELRRAAPSSIDRNLRKKLDKILSGESDIIELARDIHLIFGSDKVKTDRSQKYGGRNKQITDKSTAGIDYATPEEFREALALSSKIDRHSLTHADNPALQVILKIILKGIVKFEDATDLEIERLQEEQALKEGEEQDEWVEDALSSERSPPPVLKNQPLQASKMALSDFLKNRMSLLKIINEFEDNLQHYHSTNDRLTNEFVTKTLFIIFVMLYGCSHEYDLEDGKRHTLLDFSVSNSKNREETFLIRATKIVKLLWTSSFENSLLYRVEFDKESGILPIPVSTLIILSRWVLASILLEVRENPKQASLSRILEQQIPSIFKSTMGLVSFDKSDTTEIISGIQENIGSNKLHRQSVINEVLRLETECSQ